MSTHAPLRPERRSRKPNLALKTKVLPPHKAALSSCNGNPGLAAEVAITGQILGHQRLLQPTDVVRLKRAEKMEGKLKRPGETNCCWQGVSMVGVNHKTHLKAMSCCPFIFRGQENLGTNRLSDSCHSLKIVVDGKQTNEHFDRLESFLFQLSRLLTCVFHALLNICKKR